MSAFFHDCLPRVTNVFTATIDVSDISNTKYLYYGVLPDLAYGPCATHCTYYSDPFQNLCMVSTHELAETLTDAAVGVGNFAWYDNNYGEIGDICKVLWHFWRFCS